VGPQNSRFSSLSTKVRRNAWLEQQSNPVSTYSEMRRSPKACSAIPRAQVLERRCAFASPKKDGEDARIDIDLPTSFFSQFPEMKDSPIPQLLDDRMIPLLQEIAG
jgi:hypothetical protein